MGNKKQLSGGEGIIGRSDGLDAALRESRRLRSEIDACQTEREMAQLLHTFGKRHRVRVPRRPEGADDLTG